MSETTPAPAATPVTRTLPYLPPFTGTTPPARIPSEPTTQPHPAPTPADPTAYPRPGFTQGPGSVCGACAHRDCRARRAAVQPVAGGHRAEFAAEHRTAAAFQARHPHLILWFGEATQSYWAATPTGLHEAADTDALLLAIRPHTRT